MEFDIKTSAVKTKLGYMGEMKVYGPDKRLFWTERTKIHRPDKADAVQDAMNLAHEFKMMSA